MHRSPKQYFQMTTVLYVFPMCHIRAKKNLFIFFNLETYFFNPLNAELNPICHLLALLGAHHIFHVKGLRVKVIIIELIIYFFGLFLHPFG